MQVLVQFGDVLVLQWRQKRWADGRRAATTYDAVGFLEESLNAVQVEVMRLDGGYVVLAQGVVKNR